MSHSTHVWKLDEDELWRIAVRAGVHHPGGPDPVGEAAGNRRAGVGVAVEGEERLPALDPAADGLAPQVLPLPIHIAFGAMGRAVHHANDGL